MFDQIKKILIDTIHVDDFLIFMNSDLKDDLEIDSLTKLELILEFENTYAIRIEDAELANLKTVADIVDIIEAKLTAKQIS